MPQEVALKYYECIGIILAQENLINMNVSDYPHMKTDSRRKFFKEMRNTAQPKHLQKTVDFESFAKRVGLK